MIKSRWTLVTGALLAAGMVASLAGSAALAETEPSTLQVRVDELEEVVQAQQEQIADMAKALAAVERTADGLVAGAKSLASAADNSREHGFEAAGPNPRAKAALIDGLKKFARTVQNSRLEPAADTGKK